MIMRIPPPIKSEDNNDTTSEKFLQLSGPWPCDASLEESPGAGESTRDSPDTALHCIPASLSSADDDSEEARDAEK